VGQRQTAQQVERIDAALVVRLTRAHEVAALRRETPGRMCRRAAGVRRSLGQQRLAVGYIDRQGHGAPGAAAAGNEAGVTATIAARAPDNGDA
jgi:hypothetical protein